MKIWVNCLICNEDRFIYFAIMSVIDYVDKILVWDSGSKDQTVKIINEIKKLKGEKLNFKQVGRVDKETFSKMRQKMLEESECDWILILDGDEVWWEDSIKKVTEMIKERGTFLESIAVPFYNLVGDIYHCQEERAGQYYLLGKKGHLSIRAINRKIEGLHVENPYGSEGFFDKKGVPIQNRDKRKILFTDAPFMHLTHLKRSSYKKRENKIKYDLGKPFPKNFIYPEIFYKTYPAWIESPWEKRALSFVLKSILRMPFTFIWRRML